jgi:osmotically-inducible protein OsmY
MHYQPSVKDPVISQKVSETLSSVGIRAPCRVTVVSNKGNVTLSGTIQYEHQRHRTIRAIQAVAGVQRVVDHMQVLPSGQHLQTNYRR